MLRVFSPAGHAPPAISPFPAQEGAGCLENHTDRRSLVHTLDVPEAENTMIYNAKPGVAPPLDPNFRPAILANRAFRADVEASGRPVPLTIGIEQADGTRSLYHTAVLPKGHPKAEANLAYVERAVKFLLWQRGGCKVYVGGPSAIGDYVKQAYTPVGARAFDMDLWAGVYEKPFEVVVCAVDRCRPRRRPRSRWAATWRATASASTLAPLTAR